MQWSIRAYRPGDEAALVALYERVYGRAISEAHWRWKAKGLPAPFENAWVVEAGDKLLGQYVVLPLRVHLNGQERWVVVGVDAMVAPEARRQGIWTALVEHGHAAWAKAGVAFALGLPNERWGSRVKALGWQAIFPLQWLVRPLRPERVLAQRWCLPFLRRVTAVGQMWHWLGPGRVRHEPGVTITPVQEAGHDIDAVWQHVQQDDLVSVVRDGRWVNWRYLTPPLFTYEVLLARQAGKPVGYVAYRVEETEGRRLGFVAELVCRTADEAVRNSLLAVMTERMWEMDVDSMVTQAVPGTPLYQGYRRAGYFKGRAAFTVRLVPLAADLSLAQLCQPQNWYLVGGDFDAI
jgi:GNAT superfamily N-acetyltransferase